MTAFRSCADRDIPALKHIWLRCFEEREDAAELFFERNKSSRHAYACEADGRLVSSLYLIRCSLNGERSHYLCGAATLPEYRGRGYMSALIAYALKDAARRGDRYSVLLPASDALYGFYAQFGYRPTCAVKSAILTADADREPRAGEPDLQALQEACSDGRSLLWHTDYIRFAASYYGCYGAETLQSANAFAIIQRERDSAELHYAVYRNLEDVKALLLTEGIRRFRLTAAADSPFFEGDIQKPFGMILPLRGDQAYDNVYIGITLQ